MEERRNTKAHHRSFTYAVRRQPGQSSPDVGTLRG